MHRTALPTIAAMVVGVVAVSSSAPLIAYAAAPALAIAFWRNALAVGVLVPVAGTGRRRELRSLTTGEGRRTGGWSVLAGLALAVHFGTWVPSAKLTSIAAATALVCTSPVWTALIASLRGARIPGFTWIGIAVAVLGAALATGADITVSGRAVTGDVLALAGGAAGAVYATYGERARASLSTTSYTTVCYAVCAGALALVCLVLRVPLHGYAATTWLALVALTVGPQLLGHSLLNYALRRISATTISVVILLEVPGAALIGWAWLGQVPLARTVPGLVILVLGVLVVVAGAAHRASRPSRGVQPTNGGTAISPAATGTT
jgi:drug/metabolite transporter (DMT)-like permease